MENEKLERVLRTVDPAKRLFLKRFLFGATFAVPIVASYSLKDAAYAGTVATSACIDFTTTTTFITSTITVFVTQD